MPDIEKTPSRKDVDIARAILRKKETKIAQAMERMLVQTAFSLIKTRCATEWHTRELSIKSQTVGDVENNRGWHHISVTYRKQLVFAADYLPRKVLEIGAYLPGKWEDRLFSAARDLQAEIKNDFEADMESDAKRAAGRLRKVIADAEAAKKYFGL